MLTSRVYAWSRRHVVVVDTVIMVSLLLTFGLIGASFSRVGGIMSILLVLPLAVRRRWPVAVLAVTVVLSFVQLAVTETILPADVTQLYVLYTVAAHVPAFRTRLAALGFGLLGSVLGPARWQPSEQGAAGLLFAAFVIACTVGLVWVAGNLMRGREHLLEQLRESNTVLQRDRDQRDLIAAQGERARIAREMHDIVAHSLSVVVVQADGGAYAARHAARWGRPEAQRTMSTIAETARTALAETRRVVGVLRDVSAPLDLAPLAGLADLDGLLTTVRSSGVPVTSTPVAPDALRDLTRDVDLAAYRVVQESLTNVLKHAGPGAAAKVSIERIPGALRVTIADDGRGAGAAGDGLGNGIVGMRERVTSSGGHLLAGPRPDGGFAVTATLPVGDLR